MARWAAYGDLHPPPRLLDRELDDRGEAIRRAGRPDGWYEAADLIAAAEGMNVGRNGVIGVKYGERTGHDLDEITGRLADTAHAIYLMLLDLSEE
jgi:hypothetical protein